MGKIRWRRDRLPTPVFLGFPCGSAGKESACNTGDLGLIPGLGGSPGEGKGYSLQYFGLGNSMDCIVHGITKSWTRLSDFYPSLAHTGRMRCPMDYRSCHIGAVGLAGMVIGHWLIERRRAGKAESSPAVPRIQSAMSPNQESGEFSLV